MMTACRTLAVLVAAAAFSASASAQQGSAPFPPQGPPPNMLPENPYDRPTDMAPNERAIDSASEQLRRGIRDAAIEQAAKRGRNGARARAAKPHEIVAGAVIADKTGASIGVIETVEPDGAVVRTATGKVKVPLEGFGIKGNALLLDMSKAEFDALVASVSGKPAG